LGSIAAVEFMQQQGKGAAWMRKVAARSRPHRRHRAPEPIRSR